MSYIVTKLIDVAKKEVKYQEKKSSYLLDSKNGNVGKNNYTKYARDYYKWTNINVQGMAWCDTFVDWCFITAYGVKKARKLLGGFSAYTPTSASYFKKMNQWFKEPEIGDIVFFYSSSLGRIAHTGIVYDYDDKYVYTIEGNTSSNLTTLERDGGQVAYKKYSKYASTINGYGRLLYDKYTPSKTITKTSERIDILWLQKSLNNTIIDKSFVKLIVDGDYGNKTKQAVLKYWKQLGWNKNEKDDEIGRAHV